MVLAHLGYCGTRRIAPGDAGSMDAPIGIARTRFARKENSLVDGLSEYRLNVRRKTNLGATAAENLHGQRKNDDFGPESYLHV